MAYGFYKDIVAALEAEAKSSDHRGAGGLCRDAAAEIERLRSALRTVRAYICNEQVAHALVSNGSPDSGNWPSLIQTVEAALEQPSES